MKFLKYILILLIYLITIRGDDKLPSRAEDKVTEVEDLHYLRNIALARAEDIKIINGDPHNISRKILYDPYIRLNDDDGTPNVIWLTSYGGNPFGFEVIFFALMPLILSKLIRITKNVFRPDLHLRQGITDFPLVPLIYLQQTKLEQRVKRERRNGIDWLGKKFLIRASDNFIDVKDETHQPTQKVVPKNPWTLLRFMTKFNVVYQHTKQKLEKQAQEEEEEEKNKLEHHHGKKLRKLSLSLEKSSDPNIQFLQDIEKKKGGKRKTDEYREAIMIEEEKERLEKIQKKLALKKEKEKGINSENNEDNESDSESEGDDDDDEENSSEEKKEVKVSFVNTDKKDEGYDKIQIKNKDKGKDKDEKSKLQQKEEQQTTSGPSSNKSSKSTKKKKKKDKGHKQHSGKKEKVKHEHIEKSNKTQDGPIKSASADAIIKHWQGVDPEIKKGNLHKFVPTLPKDKKKKSKRSSNPDPENPSQDSDK